MTAPGSKNAHPVERLPSALSTGFSEAVSVQSAEGKWIHVAGQLGLAAGKPPENFDDEVSLCFGSLARVVKECGGSPSDVLRITAYLTNLDDYPAFAKARAQMFGSTPPASAAVQVTALLLGAKVEIEATAFVGNAL